MDRLLYLVFGAAIVFFGGLWWHSGQEPVVYREIVVKEIKGEPDTVRHFVDRFVYRDRPPEVVAIQIGGAEDTVKEFCQPELVSVVIAGDTVGVPKDTLFLMRSVDTDAGWFWQKDHIRLFGPTSTGDLREMRFRSWEGWSVRTDGGVLFREPRFGFLRPVIEIGVPFVTGLLIGDHINW